MSYVQITCESTGDKKERHTHSLSCRGQGFWLETEQTSQTMTANSQYYGTERRESASPGGMSVGEIRVGVRFKF